MNGQWERGCALYGRRTPAGGIGGTGCLRRLLGGIVRRLYGIRVCRDGAGVVRRGSRQRPPPPGYAAYTPPGDIARGTHTKAVTLPRTGGGYDIYVVLVKDGKTGAAHRINILLNLLIPGAAAVRAHLAANPRGGSPDNPVLLPMKMYLSGADSLASLLQTIADAGKTVTIKRPANSTGYDAAWQAAFKRMFGYSATITLRFQDL